MLDLQAKLGPLPVWTWAIGISGVGFIGYRWYQNKSAAAQASAETAAQVATNQYGATADDSVDTSGEMADGTFPNGGESDIWPGDTPGTGTGSSYTSNLQWQSVVGQSLIASGKWGATDVYNALSNFLNGIPLSQTQEDIINTALSEFGQPPEGAGPITVNQTPPTSTPSAPAKSKMPGGPYSYETTNVNIHTVPQIARHYHLTSAEVIAYNPQFAEHGWDVHALPIGVQYRIPAVK